MLPSLGCLAAGSPGRPSGHKHRQQADDFFTTIPGTYFGDTVEVNIFTFADKLPPPPCQVGVVFTPLEPESRFGDKLLEI